MNDALRTALKANADQTLAEANTGLDELVAAYRLAMAEPGYDRTEATSNMVLSLLVSCGADPANMAILLAQAISRMAEQTRTVT